MPASEPEGLPGVSENRREPPLDCYHPARGGAAAVDLQNYRLGLW